MPLVVLVDMAIKVVSKEVPQVVETANPLPYLSVILVSIQLNKALKSISLNADLLRP